MNIMVDLFVTFAKVGVCTFGGGYAMLPILQREVVEKKHWVTYEAITDYYALGQCTPGIIAINSSICARGNTHTIRHTLACMKCSTSQPTRLAMSGHISAAVNIPNASCNPAAISVGTVPGLATST